jgi:hypothetical protein
LRFSLKEVGSSTFANDYESGMQAMTKRRRTREQRGKDNNEKQKRQLGRTNKQVVLWHVDDLKISHVDER